MPPSPAFPPPSLTGRRVALVPLAHEHAPALTDALRDGEPWRLWYTTVPTPEGLAAEIDRRLALQQAGSMVPFTVLDGPVGTPVGMTTFMNIDAAAPRVEIGSTWYARRVQRTGLNTEAKLLLLEHAFEALGCLAVEFRTHFFNRASRRAIERLGAKLDGILRATQRGPEGALRDTCVYSIVAAEWPAARLNLRWMLDSRDDAKHRDTPVGR